MNWDAIGAIGEIIGASAVVVSLVYLALQIRSQSTQAKLSSLREMSRELRGTTAMFADRGISEIFVRANEDYNSLSDAESVQLIVLTTNIFRAWENAFLESRVGNLDESVWQALSREYAQTIGIPAFQHIWGLRKQNYDSGFQKYVDSIDAFDYVVR